MRPQGSAGRTGVRHTRKIGNPVRGGGIESMRRGRVVDETDLTVPKPREKRGGARQHEPLHGLCPDLTTNARSG